MVWCGVVGHGRAGQFLSRFHFEVRSRRPQMGLNSCHRDPEVLVQVEQGSSTVDACGLGGSVNQFIINLSCTPTRNYELVNVVCTVHCIDIQLMKPTFHATKYIHARR